MGLFASVLLAVLGSGVQADDRTVEQLAATVRPSVVKILAAGRDGKSQGVGTGFVVGEGLIATNLHVIGEGRPFQVQTGDGKRHDPVAVHATDRTADLAVVQLNVKGLPALPLADSDTLKQGQEIVALGHPRGLEHSVVAGVVSALREVAGRPMIQIAIPIEQGNSGGPLLDRKGRVHGLLTLKSAVTENLGFAVPITALKPLLKKPNPIPMTRWLTIGALDAEEWTSVFGARWRQRAGRIQVEGLGQGFGGRSLCLSKRPLPVLPYEVTVSVKLDDEAGAAGLVFHSDGGDRHYGFYPSGGQMRLTRFEGPDVFAWKILHQEKSPHYRVGEWNHLKVRVEKGRLLCYCNDHLVVESHDTGLTEGQVGLAKFRETRAEFKGFQAGPGAARPTAVSGVADRVAGALKELPADGPPRADAAARFAKDGEAGMAALRDKARLLERQANQLRQLATAVHQHRVLAELAQATRGKEADIDLLTAALLIARLDIEELDIEPYRKEVERMGRDITKSLPQGADAGQRLAALNRYFFQERGFHGSRAEYYHRSNSYLNEVIDDREGLPISLCVLYMEVARRIGLNVVGLNMPGHFVVKHVPAKGEPQILDVFEGAKVVSREEADQRIRERFKRPLREEDLAAAPKKTILVRILHNLLNLARDERDGEAMLRYLDAILLLDTDAGEERWLRAVLRYQAGLREGVIEDTDWLLKHHPEGVDLNRVRQLQDAVKKEP